MIRIKTIDVQEFRGIRELKLDLGGENFGICGPNGTGKSGVVDAIEFCLTGTVTRLSGQGQGELSVKGHAPHVDQREHPDKAKVTITAAIPSLGKEVTVTRSVKNPRVVSIVPDDGQVKAVINELQSHPEFALSRREIAKYIVTPPAQRSTDVQNLLRLDHIGSLRKAFLSYANKCKRDADEAERARSGAERDLKQALGLHQLDRVELLKQANAQRGILGLAPIAELAPDTSFKEGAAAADANGKKPVIAKETAIKDLSSLSAAIEAGEPADLNEERQSAIVALEKLQEDEKALALARMHGFIAAGLEFVTAEACPLCDTPWDADELRAHLKAKLMTAEEMGKALSNLGTSMNAIMGGLEARAASIRRAAGYAAALDPAVPREVVG